MKTAVPLLSVFLALLFGSALPSYFTSPEVPVKNWMRDADVSVTEVKVSGSAGVYTFDVTLRSEDKGCEQYANWWEVADLDGLLIYRRILGHSHVNEQPFTRSGGPVQISENETVIIRGHMNNSGYGSGVIRGSVAQGFQLQAADPSFARSLENAPPQPGECAF
jgi:hypothetical protein